MIDKKNHLGSTSRSRSRPRVSTNRQEESPWPEQFVPHDLQLPERDLGEGISVGEDWVTPVYDRKMEERMSSIIYHAHVTKQIEAQEPAFEREWMPAVGECSQELPTDEEDILNPEKSTAETKKNHKKRKRGLKKKEAPALFTAEQIRILMTLLENPMNAVGTAWRARINIYNILGASRNMSLRWAFKKNQKHHDELVSLLIEGRQILADWQTLHSKLEAAFKRRESVRVKQAIVIKAALALRNEIAIASQKDIPVPEFQDTDEIHSHQELMARN